MPFPENQLSLFIATAIEVDGQNRLWLMMFIGLDGSDPAHQSRKRQSGITDALLFDT
jgi:hypothetical protein